LHAWAPAAYSILVGKAGKGILRALTNPIRVRCVRKDGEAWRNNGEAAGSRASGRRTPMQSGRTDNRRAPVNSYCKDKTCWPARGLARPKKSFVRPWACANRP